MSGRSILIALGLVFVIVLVFGRGIASFWLDLLWHRGLDRTDVFWGQLGAKLTLFALSFVIFVLLAALNLWVADRTAPATFPSNVHPVVQRFHELFGRRLRIVRYGVAAVLAVLASLPATQQWQDWLLFRN